MRPSRRSCRRSLSSPRAAGALGLVLLATLVGCGEDEPPPPPPKAGAGAGARGKPAKKGKGGKALVPRLKVEDRVADPAERASIRHVFKDRDFAVEQSNRDPFQSFVLGRQVLPTASGDALPMDITKQCRREDQFVARNYSYQDLRLVGIVAERTQRKVLMMDSGNLGHIIRKGDCVGREKALVKDIGAGYITFQIVPDVGPPGAQQRAMEEHSVQLYPNQLPVMSQPTPDPDAGKPTAPVVAPTETPAEAPAQ